MTEGWNAPVSAYTAPVIDNDQPVSAYNKRKEQTRQAVRRHRCRRRHGVYRRSFDISDAQLDRLESAATLTRTGAIAPTKAGPNSRPQLILLLATGQAV